MAFRSQIKKKVRLRKSQIEERVRLKKMSDWGRCQIQEECVWETYEIEKGLRLRKKSDLRRDQIERGLRLRKDEIEESSNICRIFYHEGVYLGAMLIRDRWNKSEKRCDITLAHSMRHIRVAWRISRNIRLLNTECCARSPHWCLYWINRSSSKDFDGLHAESLSEEVSSKLGATAQII